MAECADRNLTVFNEEKRSSSSRTLISTHEATQCREQIAFVCAAPNILFKRRERVLDLARLQTDRTHVHGAMQT